MVVLTITAAHIDAYTPAVPVIQTNHISSEARPPLFCVCASPAPHRFESEDSHV
mgnify:CR=1 FL=1